MSEEKKPYMAQSNSDEWGTPVNLFIGACVEFNVEPVLDVCATFQNTKCPIFFNKESDGLKQDWDQDFFMNPPFSKAKFWIKKAFDEHRKFNVNGIAVLAARTDTKAWHDYILGQANCEVIFIQGRVKYLDEQSNPSINPSPFPSALVVWRKFN